MHRERKEVIQSLDLLLFSLFVYVWFLDANTFWLCLKCVLQVQFCNPKQMHPTWSLPSFAIALTLFNLIVVLVHAFDADVVNHRSVLLDFVGQEHYPSRLHLVLIDIGLAFIQLCLVIIAYETAKSEEIADDERTPLDVSDSEDEEIEDGQGWPARDEEANVASSAPSRTARTSLTHAVAAIRFTPLLRQIWSGARRPDTLSERSRVNPEAEAAAAASSSTSRGVASFSRARRYSRQPHAATASGGPHAPAAATTTPTSPDWPPMWLIIARNLIGGPVAPAIARRTREGWTRVRTLGAAGGGYRRLGQDERGEEGPT